MPELPEVERARALIARSALHRPIAAVDDSDTYVSRPHAPGEIADALVGREFVSAERRGKSMWLETSGDGPALGIHLGMAGRIIVDGE
jgi:formamidopyrimidine-DNA glycosylase